MTTNTENHELENDLILHNRTTTPLPLHAVALALTTQDDELIQRKFPRTDELYKGKKLE